MALQRVETDAIQDDAVTTAKIAANAVAAADIAADAITNVKVAAGAAIASSKLSGLGTAATLTAGTAANNVVQLDGSGNLPAISGVNLTGVSTDTSAMENNIAILAFKTQSANDLAKFNLVDQVIDEYKDSTGVTFSTAGQSGSTATDGYLASVYNSDTVTTPSTGDWTGDTGSYTITSGGADSTSGDDAIKSNWTSGTGDFEVQLTVTAWHNQQYGLYPVSDDASFASDETGGMDSMTASWWAYGLSEPRLSEINYSSYSGSAYTLSGGAAVTTGSVVKFKRVSGVISYWVDGVSRYTFSQTSTADLRFVVAHAGTTNGNLQSMTFTVTTPTTSAAGTATSTANTALSAPTTGDICMLIEEVDGVAATLNTSGNDLRCAISRNGGTGWDYVTLVNKGSWGTNKKILVANNVPFSNSASGTDMRYKLEWANQVAGSTGVYVTGDRTSSITLTHSGFNWNPGNGTGPNLLNGVIGDGTSDAVIFQQAAPSAGAYIRFQFGSAKIITEAKWYVDGTSDNGTWKWQGSANASSWTDIGSSFTLGVVSAPSLMQTHTQLNGNTTAYTYYQLLWVSGTPSNNQWQREIEFKEGLDVAGKVAQLNGWAVNY